MNVLVFGQTGQVATELALFDGVTCLGRADADLTDPGACEAVIAATDADAVINAAAYTAVDKAEENRDTAMIVNAMAPTAMAAAAAARGIPFVHISTDYVFDGSGSAPWQPDAPTGPLGVYGASKLGGEKGVAAAGGTYAILRTAWVFSAHGNNFVRTMRRLGAERDALTIVGDQIGGPTPARDIAAACMKIARALHADPSKSGTYHFSGAPDVSWADFAREIFAQSDLSVDVTDITTDQYPTPAKRPANSRLNCTTTTSAFGIERPDWRAGLAQVLADLTP
ncbi:dTDP-4-dehydrorhamnose reductase (plasmid) [Roseobacter fucihabitans]|uniref:dTDP-4-dehydrorhamnose reductase n=1 Tax=Roseobacter fucihabitans TaxID=1537242 RepID=A0ABZ2C2G5_9RHOB|nr:dTDP-4-dehydrorhamnose reductase [Roseobacter litoralis]MBC6967591.1 dTDP-4-dehydrorhamnose reductase [Roseobacter litoralis]